MDEIHFFIIKKLIQRIPHLDGLNGIPENWSIRNTYRAVPLDYWTNTVRGNDQ